MKKEFKVVICLILSVWIFVMGIEIGKYKESLDSSASNPSAQTVVIPGGDSGSQQPSIVPDNQEPATLPPADSDPSTYTKAQIIEAMNAAVSTLKAEQNMTAHKVESIQVEVVDCSVPAAVSTINSVIQGIAGDDEQTYTFTNGQGTDEDGNAATPKDLIPPIKKDFVIVDAGVASASARKDGDNTVYTVVLVAEDTTAAAPEPLYNAASIGYLNLMALDLPGVTITKADMHYPGSTIEIVCNAEGKVIKLYNELPMTGEGVAKIAFFEGTATFQGGLKETWDFTY